MISIIVMLLAVLPVIKRVTEIFDWHAIFLCGLLVVEGRPESFLKYCEIFILTLLNNFLMAVRKEEIR